MKEILVKQTEILDEIAAGVAAGSYFNLNISSLLSDLDTSKNIWVLGAGKASVAMAKEVENLFGDRISDGIIIAPQASKELKNIQVFEGSHPLPDFNSIAASYELLNLARKIPADDTVIFCLSGGASALFCIPSKGIEPDEMQQTYELLLNSGASIHQINVVRKHISDTSGGKLGAMLADANLFSVILSDVPGNDPQSIGSAPTVPDNSSYKDAFQTLKRFGLWNEVPQSVRIHLTRGMEGDIDENPHPNTHNWAKHHIEIISGAESQAKNIGEKLAGLGYKIRVADSAYDDEIQKVAKRICSDAISVLSRDQIIEKPAALIYFGEGTLNVKGEGKGGRNQELALNVAISVEGQHHISLLSMGTDGMDGPTDAAGAIVNSETALLARKMKLNPEEYLQDNNSYYFHKQMNNHIKTGPTGNNLMDLQVLLVE